MNYDVVGIGNALVDIQVMVNDDFHPLGRHTIQDVA